MNENRINDNHFEKLLKEKADEFVLYPSKKVWFSIYNNMHPSKKWPSITICLLLLTILFFIGNGNVKQNKNTAIAQSIVQPTKILNKPLPSNPILYSNTINTQPIMPISAIQKNYLPNSQLFINTGLNKQAIKRYTINNTLLSTAKKLNTKSQQNNVYAFASLTNKAKNTSANKLSATHYTAVTKLLTAYNSIPTFEKTTSTNIHTNSTINNALNTFTNTLQAAATNIDATTFNENSFALLTEKKQPQTKAINNNDVHNNILTTTDKSWIEHDVLYNSRKAKKWKNKLYIQAYATPSISLRHLNNNTIGKVASTQAALVYQNNEAMNGSARYTPSYGIETGIVFNYTLNKKIKLKSGLQFNFSRYTISAFDNHHPSATSITINDSKTDMPYQVYKSTSLSSKNGITAVNLHNTSYQLSIPIGIDYKLAGNENIQWYAGATLQPTIVLSGKNHLISSDYKYYIKDNSLMNRFNLHAGFETFVSFTTNGINWQVGPQIRYQLFTTNTSLYNIEEKLTNVGLKIGITKKL